MLSAWVPAIVKGGIIYFKLKAGELTDLLGGGWTSIEPAGFLGFLERQRFFVFVLPATWSGRSDRRGPPRERSVPVFLAAAGPAGLCRRQVA